MRPRWLFPMNRRDFVRSAAASILIAPLPLRANQRTDEIVIGFLRGTVSTAGSPRQFESGCELGLSEAKRAAALFGKSIRVAHGDRSVRDDAREAVVALADAGAHAVVFAGDAPDTAAAAESAAGRGLLFINSTCLADSLRVQPASDLVFHIAPSDAMREAAMSLARPSGAATAAGVRIEAWHPSLVRYGAAQLNERFRPGSAERMQSDAWSAWMSVKILWEAFLRTGSAAPARLSEFLTGDSAHFDGHKGAPLTFRSWDHQLRQPLYAISAGRPAAVEVPSLSRDDVPMKDLLDTIGAPCAVPSC